MPEQRAALAVQPAQREIPEAGQQDAVHLEEPLASHRQLQQRAQQDTSCELECRSPAARAPPSSEQLERRKGRAPKRAAEASEESEEEGQLPSASSHLLVMPPAPAGPAQQPSQVGSDPISSSQQQRVWQAAGASIVEQQQDSCSGALARERATPLHAHSTRGSSSSMSTASHLWPGTPVELLRAASSQSSQTAAGSKVPPKLPRLESIPFRRQAATHPLSPKQARQQAGGLPLSPREQQQQHVASPFTSPSSVQQAVPDLDALLLCRGGLAAQPSLASSLSLQPSWQANLASRPALDYGEL